MVGGFSPQGFPETTLPKNESRSIWSLNSWWVRIRLLLKADVGDSFFRKGTSVTLRRLSTVYQLVLDFKPKIHEMMISFVTIISTRKLNLGTQFQTSPFCNIKMVIKLSTRHPRMLASGNDQGTLIGQFLGPQILGKRRFLGTMTKQFAGFLTHTTIWDP